MCWYKYNLFERFFPKQNRPKIFRNSFSVHSVNSTQRIVQYNRDEEEYDNEKNEDLCINTHECTGSEKCEDCDCRIMDELGQVTDLVEDIDDDELFKKIIMDDDDPRRAEYTKNLGDIDIHCQKSGNQTVQHNKGYILHTGFVGNVQDSDGQIMKQMRVETGPVNRRPIDKTHERGHSSHWQRRLSSEEDIEKVSHISRQEETQYSCHLSTGLSHKRYIPETDNDNNENYEQFILHGRILKDQICFVKKVAIS